MDDPVGYARYARLLEGFYRSCYADVKVGLMASESPQVQSAIATENALRSMLRLGCPERMLARMVKEVLKLDSDALGAKRQCLAARRFPTFSISKVFNHMLSLETEENSARMFAGGGRKRMEAHRTFPRVNVPSGSGGKLKK